MKSASENLEDGSQTEEEHARKPPLTKVHTVTVCIVPPPDNVYVWKALSEMRLRLKDPGFYRWPPHVNLMYPFLKLPNRSNINNNSADTDADGHSSPNSDDEYSISKIVEQLESSTRKITPFSIRLNKLGTFGGKRRGVLWLHPDSSDELLSQTKVDRDEEPEEEPSPLIQLLRVLEDTFPVCRDQSQKGGFTPHMTLSHFPSIDEALHAKERMESPSSPFIDVHRNSTNDGHDYLEFVVDRIYLLHRKGDDGQFLRVAEIALGDNCDTSNYLASTSNNNEKYADPMPRRAMVETKIFDPPQAFPDMPNQEEEWVYQERMLLKSRRRRRGRSKGIRVPRIPDTPEVIAEKRAQRKAKKEGLGTSSTVRT
eukprot:CAMPEP_0168167402 /NCGR_PEP_ID=MMETSP0139_2-20121125/2529_1 /TAXON_ID=44445 /ORGANISM="Pseudo-nitzschia australis, Strain 10249 10 AB" /LENGTH=368 /DNA_ID=CAMNT_0008084639 /DNA_START=276 /DNA_END=1382 /DNA_ORIENTATION=+